MDEAVAAVQANGIDPAIVEAFNSERYDNDVRFVVAVAQYLGSKSARFYLPIPILRPVIERINGVRTTNSDAWNVVKRASDGLQMWVAFLGRLAPRGDEPYGLAVYSWFGPAWKGGTPDENGVAQDDVTVAFRSIEAQGPWELLHRLGCNLPIRRLAAGIIAAQRRTGGMVPLTQVRASELAGMPVSDVGVTLRHWREIDLLRSERAGRGKRGSVVAINEGHERVRDYTAATAV